MSGDSQKRRLSDSAHNYGTDKREEIFDSVMNFEQHIIVGNERDKNGHRRKFVDYIVRVIERAYETGRDQAEGSKE